MCAFSNSGGIEFLPAEPCWAAVGQRSSRPPDRVIKKWDDAEGEESLREKQEQCEETDKKDSYSQKQPVLSPDPL